MMKNFFKSLMLVAVAAMAFTACQNDVDDVNAVSKGTTLTFTANLDTETRVAFGDADAEGIRKVTWEKGDLVSFIVYDDFDNIYDYVNDVEVKADGAIAAFTVAFEKTIQTNYTIKAYVGKYVVNVGQEYNYGYDYYLVYDRGNSFTNQYPTDAGLTDVYLSAEVPYLGDDNVTITFGHDYAYGKMTVNYPVDFEKIEVEFYNANYSYANATIYGDDVKGKVFWFYCKEISDVNRVEITAYDAEDNEYVLSKDVDAAKNFRFEKGLISSFSVKDFVQKLSNPEVTGKIVDNKAVFTWNAVEHATSYDVYVNDELVKEAYTGTSYEMSLEGYAPFDTVNIEVFVNAEDGYLAPNYSAQASVTIPITKDSAGEQGYTFEYNKVEDLGQNKYKFYNDNKNEYMYLTFETSLSELAVGEYTYSIGDGLKSSEYRNDGEFSEFSLPNYDNDYYGREFWFQEKNVVYVDVNANGNINVTAFCKRWVGSNQPLFKGTWSGKLVGSVEPEPEPEEDPETIELISASATAAPSNLTYGTAYNISFKDSAGKEYFLRVQTKGNKYLEEGVWSTDIKPSELGCIDYVEWPGIYPWPCTMTVDVVGKQYDINLQATDYVDYGGTGLTHTAHFKGNIVGMTLPGESSASAVLVTDTTVGGFNPYDVTFSFANGDKVVARFSTIGNQYLHLGEWQANDWQKPHYISLVKLNGEYASVSACNVAYENDAYTVELIVYDYTAQSAKDFTYTGAIEGLNAPEACDCLKEPEPEPEPGDVITVEILSASVGYDQPGEKEMQFWYSATNAHVIDFKGFDNCNPGQPLKAGYYSSAEYTIDASYCIFDYGTTNGDMSSVECTVTVNGDGSRTYDAKFVHNGQKYAFVYTSPAE